MGRLPTLAFLLIVVVALFAAPAKAADDLEDRAQTVAEDWLRVMDLGQYGVGWDRSAAVIKTSISRPDFFKALEAVRTPLGRLISRKVLSRSHMTKLPGVPDGDYVVIQYETRFENRNSAVETITPVLDDDGVMRVAGYYIR